LARPGAMSVFRFRYDGKVEPLRKYDVEPISKQL
jgi:hypothetical protein